MSFKDELLKKVLETDSTSLDYTPTDYQDKNDVALNSVNPNIYGISFNLDTSEFEDDDDDDDDEYMDGVEVDKTELIDMLNFAPVDLINLILSILNEKYGVLLKTPEELEDLLLTLDSTNFNEYAYLILNIIDDYYNYHEDFEQYGAEPIEETVVDVGHTRQLRRDRKKSTWKRNAVLRARFRKTGEGKRQRKKALKYLKKYRRQNKAKLSRYSKKYSQIWKGDTK